MTKLQEHPEPTERLVEPDLADHRAVPVQMADQDSQEGKAVSNQRKMSFFCSILCH